MLRFFKRLTNREYEISSYINVTISLVIVILSSNVYIMFDGSRVETILYSILVLLILYNHYRICLTHVRIKRRLSKESEV